MGKYIDLGSVIDVEPPVSEVLALIEDEDLQKEFWERMDEDFFRDFVENCGEQDIDFMKRVLEEVSEESTED